MPVFPPPFTRYLIFVAEEQPGDYPHQEKQRQRPEVMDLDDDGGSGGARHGGGSHTTGPAVAPSRVAVVAVDPSTGDAQVRCGASVR